MHRMSARSMRRLERQTGLRISTAWAQGKGYCYVLDLVDGRVALLLNDGSITYERPRSFVLPT